MGLNITKNDISSARKIYKSSIPYNDDSEIMLQFDGEYDHNKMAATAARQFLESLGINPDDDNDYGDITD